MVIFIVSSSVGHISYEFCIDLLQATTTPLVRNIFELFFKNQIDDKAAVPARRKRCGICEVCVCVCVRACVCACVCLVASSSDMVF